MSKRAVRLMSKAELVKELKVSMKIGDAERFFMGDLCAAQPWLNKEELVDVAEQVDIKEGTLRRYIETAREFPVNVRDADIPWGAYQHLSGVVGSKERQLILESSQEPWTTTTMGIAVRKFQKAERTRKLNKKREDAGLPPLVPQATKDIYRANKTGCNLMGVKLSAEYDTPSKTATFTYEVPLENAKIYVIGGKTVITGIIPDEDVELEDEE